MSPAAAEDIARLKVTHRLPPDAEDRIRTSVRSLGTFPRLGKRLESGAWAGERYILGPWRWMVIVYHHDEEEGRIVIMTVQDGRSAASPAG